MSHPLGQGGETEVLYISSRFTDELNSTKEEKTLVSQLLLKCSVGI
jgi:hypothetical protein